MSNAKKGNALGTASAHLNALAELLQTFRPEQALKHFSSLVAKASIDTAGQNALQYVTAPLDKPSAGLLMRRINETKRAMSTSLQLLEEFGEQKLCKKTVFSHPLGPLSAELLRKAKHIHYFRANAAALGRLPAAKLHPRHPLGASKALDNTDIVVLEPKTATPEGIIVPFGGRTIAELAGSRGTPVYAITTAWHTSQDKKACREEELVPAELLTGVISEHGIHEYNEFLKRSKTFP
jgi:hypothetical protein